MAHEASRAAAGAVPAAAAPPRPPSAAPAAALLARAVLLLAWAPRPAWALVQWQGAPEGEHGAVAAEELRQLLAALTEKILRCREGLKIQHVGIPLYGLQRFFCFEEGQRLGLALAAKMGPGAELEAQAVGAALYGLQRGNAFRSHAVRRPWSEIRRLLRLLR